MGLKLKHFEKVIKNKSKEEILIDINSTLYVKLDQDDQGPRQCGNGVGSTIPSVSTRNRDAEIIGKFYYFFLLR